MVIRVLVILVFAHCPTVGRTGSFAKPSIHSESAGSSAGASQCARTGGESLRPPAKGNPDISFVVIDSKASPGGFEAVGDFKDAAGWWT